MEEILSINTDNNINQSKNAINFERVWRASEKFERGGMGRIG